jgi:RNA polymerase sigma-70 factor, ECF subfamily
MTALTLPVLPSLAAASKTRAMSDGPAQNTSSAACAANADETLVRDTLAGVERAYGELVSRHKGRVFGTCSRFARDAHQLDDLCQEVFIRAWRKLGSFRGDAPFEHWLARITITTCYDFLRKERRHRDQVSLDEMPIEMRDSGVDNAIAAGRAKELVEWAMRQLGPDDRLILTLLEIEERTVREISAATGWSESNVKVRAFRARGKLKELLTSSHES